MIPWFQTGVVQLKRDESRTKKALRLLLKDNTILMGHQQLRGALDELTQLAPAHRRRRDCSGHGRRNPRDGPGAGRESRPCASRSRSTDRELLARLHGHAAASVGRGVAAGRRGRPLRPECHHSRPWGAGPGHGRGARERRCQRGRPPALAALARGHGAFARGGGAMG